MKNQKLLTALENLLVIANEKLTYYENKNDAWNIDHYKNDIKIIENEILIVKGETK
jgi:hypothetical protein